MKTGLVIKLSVFLAIVAGYYLLATNGAFAENPAKTCPPEQYCLHFPILVPGGPPVTQIANPAQYIQTIYRFSIGAGALLAMVMIIWGGIQWTASAGNPSKIEDAKDRIRQAIYGFALILGAVLILTVIDPELPKLKLGGLTPLKKSTGLSVLTNAIRQAEQKQNEAAAKVFNDSPEAKTLQNIENRYGISSTPSWETKSNQQTDYKIALREALKNGTITREKLEEQLENIELQRQLVLQSSDFDKKLLREKKITEDHFQQLDKSNNAYINQFNIQRIKISEALKEVPPPPTQPPATQKEGDYNIEELR